MASTPVALVGITGPAFVSDWFESWWLSMPQEGTPVIGTTMLIGAATVHEDGTCLLSSVDWEAEVRDFAQLTVARMVGREDRALIIGMEKTATAREVGAGVVIPRPRTTDVENPSLVLADRQQTLRLPWLFGSLGPDSRGLIAGDPGNALLSEMVDRWANGGQATATMVQHFVEQERAKCADGLQSLTVWAYKGGYEWGSLVVGCPGAKRAGIRALLTNTAKELGVALYTCGTALDLMIEQNDQYGKGPIPIPEHWIRLN